MADEYTKAAEIIDAGGIIVYPTETVYGLGANPFERSAVEKVMALKGRPLHQSPLILIPDVSWLPKLTKNISPVTARLIDHFWPGPLTIVFEAAREVPSWLLRDDETIALRVSSHPWVESFMAHYQKPIISTSANVSGQPSAADVDTVKRYFPEGIGYYADVGKLSPSKSSTIVSLKDSTVNLIRQGDVSLDELKKFTNA